MSDNELRDRIAEIIDHMDNEANKSEGWFTLAMPKDLAQAIIDEFGLEVETRVTFFDNTPARKPIGHKRRVVGRWENA